MNVQIVTIQNMHMILMKIMFQKVALHVEVHILSVKQVAKYLMINRLCDYRCI